MLPHSPAHPDISVNLALAVIASSNAPVLLLDGDLSVIAASDSFCHAFHIDAESISGASLATIGEGEWNVPQLRSLLETTVAQHAQIDAYEMDLKREGQPTLCLVLNAHLLEYGDPENVRLVLAISDVTDVRADAIKKDDLVREKAILLQELQHRVANSLQIIASVLMQSARKVQSEEVRGHLHDAHSRVMSISVLQQQLSASRIGEVALRPYFTDLCKSIGASMIPDSSKLSLVVTVDESQIMADVSVSYGLIVTELVINALKHAFPDQREGKIEVSYTSDGGKWALIVCDNGIGMPIGLDAPKPGLGTGIVDALSKQLHASVRITDANLGTCVSITHS